MVGHTVLLDVELAFIQHATVSLLLGFVEINVLYLTGQILLIVALAAFSGLVLGWWSRGLMPDIQEDSPPSTEVDPFGARARLEQCHRDNAGLRRELQDTQEQLEQLHKTAGLTQDKHLTDRLQTAESKVTALMDDLQSRDDTIAVLENELEKLR